MDQSSSDNFQKVKTLASFTGEKECILCGQSYDVTFSNFEFYTFGHCDHQLCSRCFHILKEIPGRDQLCPICHQ